MRTGLYKVYCRQRTYTGALIMQTLNPGDTETVRRTVSELKGRPGPLLKILHAVQAALGHIPAGDRDHCP